jgi:hypothetical protein
MLAAKDNTLRRSALDRLYHAFRFSATQLNRRAHVLAAFPLRF